MSSTQTPPRPVGRGAYRMKVDPVEARSNPTKPLKRTIQTDSIRL
jgi:hypothetical protein